jgi:hypothetical protein
MKLAWILTLTAMLLADTALAATVAQAGGTYNYWPTTWPALSALNDPSGDTGRNSSDFYSGSGSTASFAPDNGFLSFRVRINYTGTINIQNASDHNTLTGNGGLSSWIKTGWSGPISVVPEPATGWLTGAGLLLLVVIQKCRHFAGN